jgi:predicted nucleic acid-binding protein
VILADSSVWIDHLHRPDDDLVGLLRTQRVVMHMAVLGEVALGQLRDRAGVLSTLEQLPFLRSARDHEVVTLIDRRELHGRGVGFVDVTLVASTLMTPGTRLWTRDKRLRAVADELGVAW